MEKFIISPSNCRVIDMLNPSTNKGAYSGRTIEEFQQQYPDAKIATWEEFEALEKSFYITAPKEIEASEFNDMLEVLPPARHQHIEGFEVFYNPERITGSIVAWYARFEQRYFTFADHLNLSNQAIIAKLKTAI